ncbi:MAG: MBL fold metallo-hydrolase [Spirochaetaceae bacterium]
MAKTELHLHLLGAIPPATLWTLILLFLSLLTTLSAQERMIQLSPELQIREIEKNSYLITHSFPWPANSLLLILEEPHALLIDTPYTPEATGQVLDWLQEQFGPGLDITAINTGFHIDNLGGNKALLERGIPIYGSELTAELLDRKGSDTMSKLSLWLRGRENEKYLKVYTDFDFFKPNRLFDIHEEQKLTLGSTDIIIHYPGPTHTYDNLVVYIPGKKLLFGGCMILSSQTNKPGFIEDGNLYEWQKSLVNLKNRFTDARIVIPGHGDPGSPNLIDHTEKVLRDSNKQGE